MFPLRSACADTMNHDYCTHSDEAGCIFETCVVDEFRSAVEVGYVLVDVLEFWEYSVTRFVKGSNSGLFEEHVQMLLKLKQGSFGYSCVHSEDDKDQYIEGFWRAEVIALDKASQFPKTLGNEVWQR